MHSIELSVFLPVQLFRKLEDRQRIQALLDCGNYELLPRKTYFTVMGTNAARGFAGSCRSSAATTCHLPSRLIHVSVQT